MGVLGGTCIVGGAEVKYRPAALSINTGMTGESDGLISAMGALLDKNHTTSVQLNRDQAPDPSEGLEGHHLAVHAFDMSVLTAVHAEWLAPMMGIA